MDTFTDTGALDSRLGAPAKAFVGRRNRLLIDGKLVDAASGKTFPDYNPATGTILTQVAEADAEDVDRAVKAARRAFDEGPWSKMSPSDRGKLLWKLALLIEQNSEEFAEIEFDRQRQAGRRRPHGGCPARRRHVPLYGGLGHQGYRLDHPALLPRRVSVLVSLSLPRSQICVAKLVQS